MAPEVLRRETGNTAASDTYSFGIILSEVYSRKEPYLGEDPHDVLPAVADVNINKRPPVPEACPPKAQQLIDAGCCHVETLLRAVGNDFRSPTLAPTNNPCGFEL